MARRSNKVRSVPAPTADDDGNSAIEVDLDLASFDPRGVGDAGERPAAPAALSSHQVLAVAARLGGMVNELAAIKAQLLARPSLSESLRGKLLPLFAQPVSAPRARDLMPYEEIAPGIRVGFAADARAGLTVAPRPGKEIRRGGFRNTVQLTLESPGNWISLEARLNGRELAFARHFEIGLGAKVRCKTGCRVLVRVSRETAFDDTPLAELHLHPEEDGYAAGGELAELAAPPDADIALIALFCPEEPTVEGGAALAIAFERFSLSFA